MTVEAIAASGADPAALGLEAQLLRSVTLGQMIDAQMSNDLGVGVPGLSGVAKVTQAPAADGSVESKPQVPEVLRGYGNGRIPREMLTLIGISQHRLWGPAAETFKAMRAAAAGDGVALSVTDSYRPYDDQVDLARRKGLTKDGGWAAVPGTSNHGWGLAIDADVDANGLAWLKANGARFGWVMGSTREPWHWDYCGQT